MGDLIKHGELTVEQVNHIQKDLLVGLRKKGQFWDSFCSHTVIPANAHEVEWRKLNVPELKPSDIANLSEGVTPAALRLTYVKFKAAPVNYGNWMAYTDESKHYNYDDVVRDAKLVLGQNAKEQAEIRKAKQFIAGTCTMDLTASNVDDHFLKDLLKARTILKKNKVMPIRNGKYGCILTSEQAAQVLVDYKDAITHTSENEAILDGYIGELGGFILFENTDEVMYKRSDAVEAVTGIYKFDLSGTYAENDTIVIDGVTTTLASGEDTAAEAAAAVVADAASFTNYTPTSSGATLILTEKSNKEGKGKPAIVFSNSAAVATFKAYGADGSTKGVAASSANTKGYCLFIGKTDYGMPVQTVAFGNAAVEVYDNGLGSVPQYDANNGGLRPDALHQRGSIGYKVMGFAARILADEAIIRAEYVISADSKEGGYIMNVDDADRFGYVGSATSPAII